MTVKSWLSSKLWQTPNARAQQIQSETEKRAHDLDLKYPGSTSTQVLKSNCKDGRYLVLVVGSFENLSYDFMVFCDFIGQARALKAIYSWNISPKQPRPGNEPTYFGVSFRSLGFFGLG